MLKNIESKLGQLSSEELRTLNSMVVAMLKTKSRMNSLRIGASLKAGDKVEINQPKHKGEIYEIVRVKRTNCIIQSKDNVMVTYNCPINMLIA